MLAVRYLPCEKWRKILITALLYFTDRRSTSKGGPLFSKLFRLDQNDPFTFRPKFPEILVEWIGAVSHVTKTSLVVKETRAHA